MPRLGDCDWCGLSGVPVSFLQVGPDQWADLCGECARLARKELPEWSDRDELWPGDAGYDERLLRSPWRR